jgi:tetratricopeptide (TPR) repeat protein/DNA-binding CsgD family transcriptional regulator
MTAPFHQPIVSPILLDRSNQLAILYTMIDQAKSGRGQVVLLCAEAGVGKSRLVAEVKSHAASHDFLLLQGSCFPTDHAIPYAPLLDLLRSFLTVYPAVFSAVEVKQVVQAFLPLLSDIEHLLPSAPPLSPLTPLDPEPEKRRRFETVAHFLTFQTQEHPVLLVVEDLHWSDDTSLEMLHYLARRYCSAYPLLVLLTYRSDELSTSLRHFLAQLDRERLAKEVAIDRLSREGVEAMLEAILALPNTTRFELLDPIYSLTDGNPFFVEEILTSLIASGEIYYTNGHWECKPLGELHIPRSVQDAVHQRTDRLSEPTREILTMAAVAGRRFDFALLQELSKHGEQHLLLMIKEMIAAQVVVEESEEQFAFRHALTRQAIYADLLVRERKALHRRIAETMEHLYDPALEAHLADLAYHFFEAGAWEQALKYGRLAGEQAERLYAQRTAIEQATRALDASKRGSIVPPASLYRLRGRGYENLGKFELAQADFKTTLKMAQQAKDLKAEWQALLDLGFLWAQRDYTQAGTYFQQALALARHMDDPVTLAHSLNRLGNWYVNIEQPREALLYHQEALTLFQHAQDQHGLAETYDLLGMTATLGGDLPQGNIYYQQAVELFQELDDRQGLASSLATLAILGGEYETETMVPAPTGFVECLRYGEQAVKIAREIGQRSAESYALCALGQFLGSHGDYAYALKVAQDGLALAEQIEHHEWMIHGHWERGALYLDLLALPEARTSFEQALSLAHEVGSWNWIRIVSGFMARVLILQKDFKQAESILTAALEPDAPMQTIGQRLVWAARVELALARGDPDMALSITDRLIASAANLTDERVIPYLWKLRGEALVALHQVAEAEAVLRAAQEAALAQELRPLLWRICVVLGRHSQAEGKQEEARLAFDSARTIMEELAAPILDENLRETFLSSASLRLPRPRPHTPRRVSKEAFGGLTEREREVAILIAKGKSNREIAEWLVVGNRTVEVHVSNILSKLGFTSRAQIAVWAYEKGLVNTAH